ncbi:unnamed protein product [Lymnaea stagnalis]|uniref:Granularin n=1 Tax=Lymnaea stagnalis TaxID=6523 RepID=Q6QPM8_LYMST|nr:granularin [Lymnaea stagnalis]
MKGFLATYVMFSLAGLLLAEPCEHNGVTYNPGDAYHKDQCTTCYCGEDSEAFCIPLQCDWPQCEDGASPVYLEDSCCPGCP